jgi:hypothetical protein
MSLFPINLTLPLPPPSPLSLRQLGEDKAEETGEGFGGGRFIQSKEEDARSPTRWRVSKRDSRRLMFSASACVCVCVCARARACV